MSQLLEYTFSIKDLGTVNLEKIYGSSDLLVEKFAELDKQTREVSERVKTYGESFGSLAQKIALLKAEREILPASHLTIIGKYNTEIERLEGKLSMLENHQGGHLKKWFSEIKSQIPALSLLANPLVAAAAGVYKLNSYIKQSKAVYQEESEQLTKLAAVMGNTMGARQENVESIKRLMQEQEKAGIISAGVQVAGAQELSTYLTKEQSMKSLLPVMNDMLAQQYGLNATQEQSTNIAMMMGKVMDGQVGALSRYGYKFDEAQEKILKYGTETQRAATLAEVVSESVGGVNAALRATPEGQLKAVADGYSSIQTRVGAVAIRVTAAFSGLHEKVIAFFDRIISKIEVHKDKLLVVAHVVSHVLGKAFDAVTGTISWFFDKLRSGNKVVTTITVAVGLFATALLLYNTYITITTFLQTKLTWAVIQTNLAFLANPVTLIVLGIVALIAAIGYLIYKVDGWGEAWDHTVSFAKKVWETYVNYAKAAFTLLVEGVMIGIDKIKLGWYQFKEAVGLGNSSENQSMITMMNESVENRKKAIVDAGLAVAKSASEAWGELQKAGASFSINDNTLEDGFNSLKSKFGIGAPEGIPGAGSGSGSGGEGSELSKKGKKASESIATGGTKHNYITINLKDLVGQLTINGKTFKETTSQMEDEVLDALLRVTASAITAGG